MEKSIASTSMTLRRLRLRRYADGAARGRAQLRTNFIAHPTETLAAIGGTISATHPARAA